MRHFKFNAADRSRPRKRINRAPSTIFAQVVPWITVMLGSLVPTWIVVASGPIMPPLAFLLFIAWRQLRPGLLPMWAGAVLGLFDDLYSGQPPGSAVLQWSAAAIVLDMIETQLPWRNFLTEWLVAAGLIAAYIIVSLGIANMAGAETPITVVVPQIILSILAYPLVCRLAAAFDRIRLTPFMEVR